MDEEDHSARAELDAMYRMPWVFGPAAGPRNVPFAHQRQRYANDRAQLTVDALTDEAAIAALLPPGCRLAGEPVLRVGVACVKRIGWLAGRGYNIIAVQFPHVEFAGRNETVAGVFDAVLWENLCDPIITGREEIAIPKIYAEIPDHVVFGRTYSASASWQGFRFLDLEVADLADAPEPRGPAPPRMSYKYLPRTGEWGQADAEYMTVAGPDPLQPPVSVQAYREGRGHFAFRPARWEDMPTQYNVVSALAKMPIRKFLGASLKITSQGETDSVGGGGGSSQRIIR